MGYYSNVNLMLGKKAYEEVKASIKEFNKTFWEEKYDDEEHFFKPDSVQKFNDTYLMTWNDVKWYSYFKDVQAVTKTLHKWDDYEKANNPDYAYKLIVVGEDNMTEEECNPAGEYFGMYTVCTVETDDPFEDFEDNFRGN